MSKTVHWFQVDKEGLSKIVRGRGRIVVLHELIANAWDTSASTTRVTFTFAGRCAHLLVEDDDPDGFRDISHAYTLFAESLRKTNEEKRGRFNFGEKVALAFCRKASIVTTTGSVVFEESGVMRKSRARRPHGSVFEADIPMTVAEYKKISTDILQILPPKDRTTIFNGECIPHREPVTSFEATLPTVRADEEGVLRPSTRKTIIHIHEPLDGETPMLFEMGIPVCETDRFHVDVQQKVPLGIERDNVPTAFRKALRTAILNHCADRLSTEEEVSAAWVTEALGNPKVNDDAVRRVIHSRFGENAVAFDLSDVEASHTAVSKGWKVVYGRSLPKEVWENVRRAGVLPAAGKKIPTPKPYSDDPNAEPVPLVKDWTPRMREVADIAVFLADKLGVRQNLRVLFVQGGRNFLAAWGSGGLDFNYRRLGRKWFEEWRDHRVELLDLLIHEFAHQYADNHLDESFHKACTKIGAKMAMALAEGGIPHW